MWAFRKLRSQGLPSRTGQTFCGKTEFAKCCSGTYNAVVIEPQATILDGLLSCTRFYRESSCISKSKRDFCTFLSQANAKNNGEDLEDDFSELKPPQDTAEVAVSEDENDDLSSKSELSEEEDIVDVTGRASSAMARAILAAIAAPVSKVLEKWVEEGNEVTQSEVALTIGNLRKRRLFLKALQLSEWVESTKHVDLTHAHYVSRVDLIAKVLGPYKAENYLQQIPGSFKTELVYRTLLANCAKLTNVNQTEELFEKMKDLGFPITTFACNQLLFLYKRTNRKKIADVLLLMEKENLKPSAFTYQILIDVKGQSKDISGMEKLVETMKAEGLEPSSQMQTSLARHYAAAGLKDKAESVLKELEGDDLEKKPWARRFLMPMYAALGRADDVERIWKHCESEPRLDDCMAAIEAWGRLKKVENAEAAFHKMLKKVKHPSSKHYAALLKVYADHKMLTKGKDLVNQMLANGCIMEAMTWDALVKLYVGVGDIEKADKILGQAMKKRSKLPLLSSFMTIMGKYAERGDVRNAEKVLQMMREARYPVFSRQYQILLKAYVNGKTPAYGFIDRMKADNIFPNRFMGAQLAKVDPFKRSAVDDLLE